MIATFLLAACTLKHDRKVVVFTCPTTEQCEGILHTAIFTLDDAKCITLDRNYLYETGKLPNKPNVLMLYLSKNPCAATAHLHKAGATITEPDVKGGPLVVPDGLCHDDHSDKVVDK